MSLFRGKDNKKIVEGFLAEYTIKEPPVSWKCKHVSTTMSREGRFNFVKKEIVTPLHPPVIRTNGELYLHTSHEGIYKYDFTEDNMISNKRNDSQIVIVTKEQEQYLKNHYVKLSCTSELVDDVEYLRIHKVLKRRRAEYDSGRITLALEIDLKPKTGTAELFKRFIVSLLVKFGKGKSLEFYEYENCYYLEIKDGYYIHYNAPFTLGIYSRVEGGDIREYRECCNTIGKINDLFRKYTDNSVDFRYKFVSDKNILLYGIR